MKETKDSRNADERWLSGTYFVPLVPMLLMLLYAAFRGLGLIPSEPAASVVVTTCALLSIALAPLPFILRQFARRISARASYGSVQQTEALLAKLAQASEQVGRATASLDTAAARLEPPPATPAEKRSAVGLSIVIVLGFISATALISTAFVQLPNVAEVPHNHASLAVFVNGDRVNYSGAAFDLAARQYLAAHLHAPNQDILHLEGRIRITISDIFARALASSISHNALRLDKIEHSGETFVSNETHHLSMYVSPAFSDGWVRVRDIPSYEPRQKDRLLVTYGVFDQEALEREFAAVSTDFPLR